MLADCDSIWFKAEAEILFFDHYHGYIFVNPDIQYCLMGVGAGTFLVLKTRIMVKKTFMPCRIIGFRSFFLY